MPETQEKPKETRKEEYQKTTEWLKQHWREVAIGALAALAAVWYLFIRGTGSGSTTRNTATIPDLSARSLSDQQAQQSAIDASSQAATSGIQQLAAKVVSQIQNATNDQQTQFQQQFQAAQGQQAQQQSSFAAQVQQWMAQLAQSAQQAQQAVQAQAAQLQVALGQVPSGVSTGITPTNAGQSTPAQIATWAQGLGANVQTITQAVAALGGNVNNISLTQLNQWLSSKGWNGGLSPQANQYKQQQGSSYTPGNAPATANSPAGGGIWMGLNDQQTQALFRATYGANWQNVWNQQHAAAVTSGN